MTCNNIILAKPEAGASVPYSLPAGESARLSFGPGEISGLNLNADGALVIRFVEGGELSLTNFQEMVDGGNLLYLADGTLVDPAVLQASLASYVSPAAGSDAIVVGIPAANQVKEYTVEAGKEYVLDFDIDVPVTADRQNGDFVMTFENGGMVVMRGYETAMASADAPTITSSSKVCVYEGEELITNIQTLAEAPVVEEKVVVEEEVVAPKKVVQVEEAIAAEEVALVEPAAGEPSAETIAQIEPAAGEPGASNSGYGFNSTPGTDPLGSLADVGPIDPTALNYGVDFNNDPNRVLFRLNATGATGQVDETDIPAGMALYRGSISTNAGNDGLRSVGPNGHHAFEGSLAGGNLTSGGVPVVITATANGYQGHANGQLIFDFTIDNTGAFTYEQHGPFDHADPNDPNDIITMEFGIVVVDRDGDNATVNIRIDVLDDVPVIHSAGGQVDETDLSGGPVVTQGTVSFSAGQDIPPSAFGPTGDEPTVANGLISGSLLNNALTSNGVPVVITYDAATRTYTGTAGATTVFTMQFGTQGDYTFTLNAPVDHGDPNDPNDIINIDFPVAAVDFDGDTATGSVRIQILDDAPVIGDSRGDVDETNFDNGPLVYESTVPNTFGIDLSTVEGTGVFNPSTPLTSGGQPVTVNFSSGTYTATLPNGTIVFTLQIDPQTGRYIYTQHENLDHPNTSDHNDIISLEFEVRLENTQGDISVGTITIDVADDGPTARNDYSAAEEGQTITGDVLANDDSSTDSPNLVTVVNFGGTDYPITAGGTVTINGTHGTLTIGSDGKWTYVANADVPDNVENRDSFTYTLRDRDGDTSTAVLQITVTDDGIPTEYPVNPGIGDDALAVDETSLVNGDAVLNGKVDVISNGETISSVTGVNNSFTATGSMAGGTLTSGGQPVTVTFDAATNTYTGTSADGREVFTLEITGTQGDYVFTLKDTLDHADSTDPNDIIRLDFGVRVTDTDGDTADGKITVRVYDDAPVARDDGAREVVDSETVNGNVVLGQHGANGQADTLGQDGPVHVAQVFFNGAWRDVPTDGSNLKIEGNYGTLEINNTGAYTYTAKNNNNPGQVDTFGYALEDFDGDRDTATFSFRTKDDAEPIIVDGADQVDETNLTAAGIVRNGTVTVNSSTGNNADLGTVTVTGNNTFTSGGSQANNTLTHQGQPVNVTFDAATNTYTGATAGGTTVFTMQFAANGSYTFRLLSTLDHADGTNPNDAITLDFGVRATDGNGDVANGKVTVTVYDDAPEIGNSSGSVDEANNIPISVSGTVPHDFGADGTGQIRGTGTWDATDSVTPGGLTSGGQLVNVQWDTASNSYVGTINGGATTVFTLSINPATGSYTYTQYQTLDHADPNDPRDNIRLTFGIEIVDYDGDTDQGVITIDVRDDGPSIVVNATGLVDETNLASGVVDRSGNLTVIYSGDGTGSVSGNGSFDSNGSKLGGNLTHQGQAVNVTFDAATNTYTGATASGITVFTLVVSANGAYAFRLHENLDHANASNPNDEINLVFGVTATPTVGTAGAVNGTVTITVRDDAPIARDDNGGTTSGTNPVRTGNVLSNDTTGQDTPTYVSTVTINGVPHTVPAGGGNATIDTPHGTLVINREGAWTYTAKNQQNGTDVFTYTIRDYDGDTSNATLTVVARDGIPVAVNDRTDLGRSNSGSGNVLSNDNPGSDGGLVVTNPGTYNLNFGTLVINANGDYSYTRYSTNGSGTDTFTYTARDADGDTTSATLTLTQTPPPPPPVWWGGDGGGGGGGGDGGGDGCPLIIDLTGMGITLTNKANGVSFDMDQDGVADQTAWAGVGSGFLVLDKNGDGTINNRSEMFGDTDGFTDGFDNLASYDTNGDGVIDANDEIYGDLRVWHDLNQDGVSDEGELLTLAQIGIVSIRLQADLPEGLYVEGNWISHVSTIVMEDGSERAIVDAWLKYDKGFNVVDTDGSDVYGNEGADAFLFTAIGEAATTVHNFNVSEGDRLDLSAILQGQDDVTDAINDFVYARQDGDDLVISVDVTGSGNLSNAVDIARLDGVEDLDLDSLLQNGNIVL